MQSDTDRNCFWASRIYNHEIYACITLYYFSYLRLKLLDTTFIDPIPHILPQYLDCAESKNSVSVFCIPISCQLNEYICPQSLQ